MKNKEVHSDSDLHFDLGVGFLYILDHVFPELDTVMNDELLGHPDHVVVQDVASGLGDRTGYVPCDIGAFFRPFVEETESCAQLLLYARRRPFNTG